MDPDNSQNAEISIVSVRERGTGSSQKNQQPEKSHDKDADQDYKEQFKAARLELVERLNNIAVYNL